MRSLHLGTWSAFCAGISLVPLPILLAANTPGSGDRNTCKDLVRLVIQAEVDGSAVDRQSLLDQALASDPNFASARWQAGFVQWHGAWLHIDDLPDYVRRDARMIEYRKRRDALVDTADNHRALAKWCREKKLTDEERLHWTKVLAYDANDLQASAALRLKLHHGRSLTAAQIEQEKKREARKIQDLRRWRPKITRWRRTIEMGPAADRSSCLARLDSLDDATAIPALEMVFADDVEGPVRGKHNRLLIQTVGHIQHPDATATLVRWATEGKSKATRMLAIDELKKRPKYTYVPQLIDAFPGSVEIEQAEPGAGLPTFVIRHENRKLSRSITATSAPLLSEGELGQLRIAISQYARRASEVKQNVQVALRESGLQNVEDREACEKEWDDQNGWYSTTYRDRPRYWSQTIQVQPAPRHSCFPAGTPVVTMSGPTTIERIKIGDRVLAQNPDSGELAFKTVQQTTIRPAMPMVRIGLGAGSLQATRGHPIWVVGSGWKVAKDLKIGERLHSVDGALTIDSHEDAAPTEAYNLVVDDWHTYFVGPQRVLVHDNSPMQERSVLVPGLPVRKGAAIGGL